MEGRREDGRAGEGWRAGGPQRECLNPLNVSECLRMNSQESLLNELLNVSSLNA